MLNQYCKELYEKVIDKWGIHAQVDQTIEECAELVVALRHFDRKKTNLKSVTSEIADVEIMCGQLRIIFGDEAVQEQVSFKLRRLENKLTEK